MTPDPYQYFRIEANELVDQLDQGVLELDRRPGPELVGRLLRATHTLKGAARVVKVAAIADEAHAMEDALAPYRQTAGPPPPDLVRGLLDSVDRLRAHIAALSSPDRPADRAAGAQQPDEAGRTAWSVAAEVDELLGAITEASTRLTLARRQAGTLGQARHLADLLVEQVAPRANAARTDTASGLLAKSQRTTLKAFQRDLSEALDHAERSLRHAREVAEQLRLAPVSAIFTSLDRAARDAAEAQHRNVVFEGRGGDIRLGPHILGEVQKALSHVVRNAVVHGIETEADRRAAGKPPRATIVVEVIREGKRVRFVCRDDGRGFDLDAVRAAVRAHDPTGTAAAGLGADELFRTLLRGGISTSTTVTEVAGRGIGLDVVRAVAERLRGEVAIRSEAGRGAAVELVVPVSLVSLDGLVVEADGRTVTIPLDAVRRTVRVRADDVVRTAHGNSILYDGQAIAFAPLADLLAAEPTSRSVVRAWSVVIVSGATGTAAVGVDRLLGPGSVILRQLPDLVSTGPTVAGASLDADGTPRLVLDPDGLVAQAGTLTAAVTPVAVAQLPILVVDDSVTTRMLEQSILESAGYTVETASSAEEALEQARDRRYGLILVDVEMPGIDGFTFIERIRSDAALRDIPAILVSSRAAPEDRRRGDEVGADGYVVKGEFDQTALLQRIRTLVA